MLKTSQQEREHAAAELAAIGVRDRFGVDSHDAVTLLSYLAMAIRFALVVRPDFRELRLAAVMYETWRREEPAAGPDCPSCGHPSVGHSATGCHGMDGRVDDQRCPCNHYGAPDHFDVPDEAQLTRIIGHLESL
jgi:hypothetical protein